jgi:methyltransferase-like protein
VPVGFPFAPAVIIGCKSDLSDKKKVKTEEALEFAEDMLFTESSPDKKKLDGTQFFLETSSKENVNITEAFTNCVKFYLARYKNIEELNNKKKKKKKGLFASFGEE